jgi:DNA-binding transcriptional LysR family regulator
MGLSQPSASRIIAHLERHVSVSLHTRSTRGLNLTEEGADYLARVEPLLLSSKIASGAKLEKIIKATHATLIIQHEPADIKKLPELPGFLD